jgi:hypothetical protein
MVMQEKTVATELEMVSWYLVELCLTEYSMVKFCPSQLAAAAVYTALNTLAKETTWGPALQKHSGYTESQLKYVCNAPFMPFFRLIFCIVLHCQSSLTSL